ncbi:mitochondrial carrier protein, putative [Bodo saltans]|uniref:ADP/ATP translocase n=1 Tax=Bodo saltans TaxID=75058 RepID=A0A0S4IU86_BODSA|nr:mitochondrial carrier protein, putative [Bodo saltans]|eukprot:CUF94864.1 mitochondrial carrier protein, putative [Bodo saltans]
MSDSASGGFDMVSVEEIQFACLSRGFAKTLIAPLDRVKYLLQCQGELQRLGRLDEPFRGALGCTKHVVSVEGWRSFLRGNLVQVGGILPSMLSQYFIAIPFQRTVFDVLPHSTAATYTIASFASGMAGALGGAIVSYPLDFARFRLAVDVRPWQGAAYEFRHSLDLFSHPAIVESPHSAYRGLGLFLAGSLLYRGVYLSTFQLIMPFLPSDSQCERSRAAMAVQVLSGFGLVSLATIWLYPIDTIRRRMMLAVTHEEGQYVSAVQCARVILQREGPAGFFRGAGFAVFRGGVTTMLAMVLGLNVS